MGEKKLDARFLLFVRNCTCFSAGGIGVEHTIQRAESPVIFIGGIKAKVGVGPMQEQKIQAVQITIFSGAV